VREDITGESKTMSFGMNIIVMLGAREKIILWHDSSFNEN
jgi:hypothetical protein